LGAAVLSTDEVVHTLYQRPEVKKAVVDRWGSAVMSGDSVDRSQIAAHVFSSPQEREWLEALLWPKVREQMASWRQSLLASATPPRLMVVEVPLLFESGIDKEFDATVVVTAKDDLRLHRAEKLKGAGVAALLQREAHQLSQAEKAARATYVLDNSGTVDELRLKIEDLTKLLAECSQ
jgi:dephospho-CoA kinase